jgi:putative ABC transport system permease protein
MWHWSAIVRRFRALVTRSAVEREMDEELQLHFDMEIERLAREGLTPSEARRAAVHTFGGIDHVKEAYRDARGVRPLENLMQDLRYAIRGLRRHRVFAVTAILTFAIGLGAMTAILTLADAAWFSWSGAFPAADRLVLVQKSWPSGNGPTSPHDFRDWQHEAKSFSALAAYMRYDVRMVTDDEPVMVGVAATSAEFFSVFGLEPALGRFYVRREEDWGRHGVVVLSYQTWQRQFAADPAVVGRTVTVNDAPMEVIGVAPRGAWFASMPPAIYVPLSFAPNDPRNARHSHFVTAIGRLGPSVTLERARSDMRDLAARITSANPENQGTSAAVNRLEDVVLADVKPTLRLLLGAVVLLLVIACANVANLLLLRGATRSREIALRSALGAPARRIMQQLLTEGVLLAVAGGIIGAAFAITIVRVLGATLPVELPRVADVGIPIDWRVALGCLAIVLASGMVCGLLPSIQLMRGAARRGSANALRESSRGVAGGRRFTTVRSALVVGQMAIALVLLVTSGLFVRSLLRLQQQDAGVRPTNVMSVRLVVPHALTLDTAAIIRFYDDVVRRVVALPGVTAVGVTSNLPLTGGGETKSFYVEGREPAALADVPEVVGRMESARSLEVVGATLIRGRSFAESDAANAPFVAILSERVARRFFGSEDPIGKRISLHPPESLYPAERRRGRIWPRWTVIGVVKNVNYTSPGDEPEDAVYVHYPQGKQVWNWGPQWLVARTAGPPSASAAAIRGALRAAYPTLPVQDMLPLTDRMDLSLRAPRFTARLIATFAVMAVLLGVVGLYGVVAYAVAQETREFGVRIALGATPGAISRHVVARGTRLALLGIAAGLTTAFATTKLIQAELFGTSALDPLAYAFAVLALLVLTALASYVPARRAAKTDPLLALRAD